MSVKTVSTRHFECDRCGASKEFPNDSRAEMDGWAIVTVNDRETILCSRDRNFLDFFLMGDKTPAGCRFNAEEASRVSPPMVIQCNSTVT